MQMSLSSKQQKKSTAIKIRENFMEALIRRKMNLFHFLKIPEMLHMLCVKWKVLLACQMSPFRGFRDTGYSRKKLPGYGIFEEKVIGIPDIEK